MSPVQKAYFQIRPNSGIDTGLATIKSIKATALGLKPHLLGLRKHFLQSKQHLYIWKMSLEPLYCTLKSFINRFSPHFLILFSPIQYNIQWFWPRHPQIPSHFINYFTISIKINHIFLKTLPLVAWVASHACFCLTILHEFQPQRVKPITHSMVSTYTPSHFYLICLLYASFS